MSDEYDCECPEDEDLVELMSPQPTPPPRTPPRPFRTTTVETTSSTVIEPAESGGEVDCYCEDDEGAGAMATTPPDQAWRPPTPSAPKTVRKTTTMRQTRLDFDDDDDDDDYYCDDDDDDDFDCACPPPEGGVRRVTRQTVRSSTTRIPKERDIMSRTRAGLEIPASGRRNTPPKNKFPWIRPERVRIRRVPIGPTDENVFPHHLDLPEPEPFRPPSDLRRSPIPPRLLRNPERESFRLYERQADTPQDLRNQIFAQCPAYTSPDVSRQQEAPNWGSPIQAEPPRRGRRSRRSRTTSESDALNVSPIRGQGARIPGWTPEGRPMPKPNPRTVRSPPCPAYETPDPAWYGMSTPSPGANAACRPPSAPRAGRVSRRLFGEDSRPAPIRMGDLEDEEPREIESSRGYDRFNYSAPAGPPRARHPAAEKLNKTFCYRPSERMVTPRPRAHTFSGFPSSSCQGCCSRNCCDTSH